MANAMRSRRVSAPEKYRAGWWFAGYLLVFSLGVVVGTYASPLSPENLRAEATVEAREGAITSAPPVRRQVVEMSGSGDHSEGPFDLLEGTALVYIQFEGQRTCRVRLVNERGESTTPVDSPGGFVGGQFGPWKARALAQIPSNGRYFVEVSGEGDWKVVLSQ